MERLTGPDLYRKVTELGDIDKKQKASLCGYGDSYGEFIEAWLEASTAALGLSWIDGSIPIDANQLTGTEGHKGLVIKKSRLHKLFAGWKDNAFPDVIEFCCTFYSENAKPELKAVLAAAEITDYSGNKWLVFRHMTAGDDAIVIATILESCIKSLEIEIEENEAWSYWSNNELTSTLPSIDWARLTTVDRVTNEEVSCEELYELPTLPPEVLNAVGGVMHLGPAFKWDNSSETYRTQLDLGGVSDLAAEVDGEEDFTFYSEEFNRGILDLLKVARPSSAIRTWFPH